MSTPRQGVATFTAAIAVLSACGGADAPAAGPTPFATGRLEATPLPPRADEDAALVAPDTAGAGTATTDDDVVATDLGTDAGTDDATGPGADATDEAPPSTAAAEDAPPAASGPSDAERAAFVASFRPDDAVDLEHVAADVTGDGDAELVFAWVGATTGQSHLALAAWGDGAYGVTFEADGGPADDLARLRVADVNADGRVEVVVLERRGRSRASASVWTVASPSNVRALVAEGGCNDGSATYGVVGVAFVRGADGAEEIHATCDESPLPPDAWGSHVYRWEDGAYRHVAD